jgi:hypothetical protein
LGISVFVVLTIDDAMDCKTKIKELREMTGMNRKNFCKYFNVPYRTVTEWKLGNRHAPADQRMYLIRRDMQCCDVCTEWKKWKERIKE